MLKQIHVNECDSTQEVLKEQLALHGPATKVLVSCENQWQGRGRGSNLWQQTSGSLCFSMNLEPHGVISFTAIELSLLVVRFFETQGVQLQLKWPNDLWNADGIKCGGILVQNHQQQMLAGVGINLFSDQAEYGGIYHHRIPLERQKLAGQLAQYIHQHRYISTQELRIDWEKRCGHMRLPVTISEGGESWQGQFLGLGEHGEALLAAEAGIKHLYNGSLRRS
jgi:BirA family transcriptional regulator, biotin operon repressor / biotin---[acetyl-CoA-carboxylase] ligase